MELPACSLLTITMETGHPLNRLVTNTERCSLFGTQQMPRALHLLSEDRERFPPAWVQRGLGSTPRGLTQPGLPSGRGGYNSFSADERSH